MSITCMVAHWILTHLFMGYNPFQINSLASHSTAILLFYSTQTITIPKFCIFSEIYNRIQLYCLIASGTIVDRPNRAAQCETS